MDFLDELTHNLSKAAEYTVKKAGELTDTAKLKLKQNRAVNDIEDIYQEIGKLIYTQYKEHTDETQTIAAKCFEIDKKKDEIQQILAELEKLKNAAKTAQSQQSPKEKTESQTASSENIDPSKNAAASEAEKAEDSSVAPFFCPACGAEIPKDSVFCPKCGQKQEQIPEKSGEPTV